MTEYHLAVHGDDESTESPITTDTVTDGRRGRAISITGRQCGRTVRVAGGQCGRSITASVGRR